VHDHTTWTPVRKPNQWKPEPNVPISIPGRINQTDLDHLKVDFNKDIDSLQDNLLIAIGKIAKVVNTKIESTNSKIETNNTTLIKEIKTSNDSAIGGLTPLLTILGLTAATGPIGLGVMGLYSLLKKRKIVEKVIEKVIEKKKVVPVIVEHETEIKPVIIKDKIKTTLHQNVYTDVDSKETDRAWAKSHSMVVDKYPGTKTYFIFAEHLKDLILSGEENPEIAK